MHAWFTRPLRFGDPQPCWKDIAAAARRKTPLSRWHSFFFEGVSGKTFVSHEKFYEFQDDDAECYLFAIHFAGNGDPDFDHLLTFATSDRRREIEDEIARLRDEIDELELELEGY